MGKCPYYEQRGWANDYCLKKDDYVNDGKIYDYYCNSYSYSDCPIYCASSGSSGCYLTTACVNNKNLPDNCHELETLRSFRDNYLAKEEGGEAEILEYYRTAPHIVKQINKREDASEIYTELYDDVIMPCVKLIDSGNNEEAHIMYSNMVKNLAKKYY